MSCVRPEGQQRDEKGISVRAGGIYGDGMALSMETEAAKVSNMMVQLSGISGDAIGVVKNFSKAMEWNPRGAENGFDLQGGLCNLVGGVPGIMVGLKEERLAKLSDDKTGQAVAKWHQRIGGFLVAAGCAKIGSVAMALFHGARLLPEALVPLMEGMGMASGGFFALIFLAILGDVSCVEREGKAFCLGFREKLIAVLREHETEVKDLPVPLSLPKGASPRELYERAKGRLKEEILAPALVQKMRSSMTSLEREDQIRKALFDLIGKERFTQEQSLCQKETAELYEIALQNPQRRIFRQNLERNRDEWNEKINYERMVERVVKGDVVKEIKEGNQGVLEHLFKKWEVKRVWNRMMGAVSLISLAVLIPTVLAGVMPMAAPILLGVAIAWTALSLVYAIFDGKGYLEAFRSKKVGTWDLKILLAKTAAVLAVTVTFSVLTIASGGVLPLLYCLIAGGAVLALQLGAWGWLASRLKEKELAKDEELLAREGTNGADDAVFSEDEAGSICSDAVEEDEAGSICSEAVETDLGDEEWPPEETGRVAL